MSYFTGADYLLYSKNENQGVFRRFNEEVVKLGFHPMYLEEKDSEHYRSSFYSKNDAMLKLHEEKGYNTDLSGEGCFYLYSGIEELDAPYIVEGTLDAKNGFMQYVWFPGRYYYYMLTLPADINKDEFSRKIFNLLKEILASEL